MVTGIVLARKDVVIAVDRYKASWTAVCGHADMAAAGAIWVRGVWGAKTRRGGVNKQDPVCEQRPPNDSPPVPRPMSVLDRRYRRCEQRLVLLVGQGQLDRAQPPALERSHGKASSAAHLWDSTSRRAAYAAVSYSLISPPRMVRRAIVCSPPGTESGHGRGGRRCCPRSGRWGVVVLDILGQHGSQVTSAEDQQAVGEFGSDCADKPLRVAIGLGAPRWDLHDLDSRVGQDGIEHIGELAGAASRTR